MCECFKQSTVVEEIIMQEEKIVKDKAQARAGLRAFYILVFVTEAKGRRIGTYEIQDKLAKINIRASLRTIQRDLNQLKDINAPIKSDGCQPQGWSFNSDNLLKEVA